MLLERNIFPGLFKIHFYLLRFSMGHEIPTAPFLNTKTILYAIFFFRQVGISRSFE